MPGHPKGFSGCCNAVVTVDYGGCVRQSAANSPPIKKGIFCHIKKASDVRFCKV